MAWNNNIPLATHKPSVDQPLMQQNFSQVQTSFSVDHIALGTAPDGYHKQITFNGTATGAIVPAGTQSVITPDVDAANFPVSGRQELWFTTVDLTAPFPAVDVQITNSKLTAASGAGMLPGGLQIRTGTGKATGAGNPETFSPQFPTACLGVVMTATSNPTKRNTIFVAAKNATGFTATSKNEDAALVTGDQVNIFYIAIGY